MSRAPKKSEQHHRQRRETVMGVQILSIHIKEVRTMCQRAPIHMTIRMTTCHPLGAMDNHEVKVK